MNEHDMQSTAARLTELERFRLAVACATDHIIMTDAAGVILYANAAAQETTGYSVEEMLGKTPALWGKQMDAAFYRRLWDTIRVRKIPFKGELTNRRKDGVTYEAEIHIAPVLDREGAVLFYVGIERDITAVKNLSRAKTQFISLASHNLKTPLAAASWFAEMLLAGDAGALKGKQREYVEEIAGAVKTMAALVSSLLNISRFDLGTYQPQLESCDVCALVRQVVDEERVRIEAQGVRCDIDCHHDARPIVTDTAVAAQVVHNVLSNAIKYSRRGGDVRIMVRHVPKGAEVYGRTFPDDRSIIAISDSGIGIPDREQAHIFSQFFRASNVGSIDAGGSGLGLYLVQAAVRAMGGDVWFTSQEGVGTQFAIALPYEYERT